MSLPVWPLRRFVQLAVLFSLIAVPVVSRYNHYLQTRQLDRFVQGWSGSPQAVALVATDRAMRLGLPAGDSGVKTRRPRTAVLQRTRHVLGSPWSMKLFGISLTDLVAGAECVVTSRAFTGVLALGLLIPLIATLLLGRVYCGWICPMRLIFDLGLKMREALAFLEVPPGRLQFAHRNKYVLFAVGLACGFFLGVPLLHYLYPPALLGREAHGWVAAMFDRAEQGRTGLALAGLSGATLFLFVVVFIEVVAAPGVWCRSLCPGGAVYSALGRWRAVRVRRDPPACTSCADCDKVCPMGVKPMVDRTGQECDNCGICIDVCPTRALSYKVLVAALALAFAGPLEAHHILGIPHYAYDESYPQAPVMRLREVVGEWEVMLTCYPGTPKPGERSEIHVYVTQRHRMRRPYGQPLALAVYRQTMMGGKDAIYGPTTVEPQQNLYKFFPRYAETGHYEVLLELARADAVDTLRFPMVVGEPGNPWVTTVGFVGGLAFLVIVVRAIKIKRQRRLGRLAA